MERQAPEQIVQMVLSRLPVEPIGLEVLKESVEWESTALEIRESLHHELMKFATKKLLHGPPQPLEVERVSHTVEMMSQPAEVEVVKQHLLVLSLKRAEVGAPIIFPVHQFVVPRQTEWETG